MSTITDPIILDSTGQAIKNSIDLLSANINRTASNIPYDSNLTIKAAIDGKVSKSGDTMTGNLYIHKANSGTSLANSEAVLGNNIAEGITGNSRGVLRFYGTGTQRVSLFPSAITGERDIVIPDKSGTMALESDITFRRLSSGSWSWNTQASYSIDAYSGNSVIVFGARSGKGFMAICPNNNNEVFEIINNTGCTISQTYDSNTGKHTITLSNRTSYVGSNVFVYVIG